MPEKDLAAESCELELADGTLKKMPNPDEETTTVMHECAMKMAEIMCDYKVPSINITVEDDYGIAVTVGFKIIRVHTAEDNNRPGREL